MKKVKTFLFLALTLFLPIVSLWAAETKKEATPFKPGYGFSVWSGTSGDRTQGFSLFNLKNPEDWKYVGKTFGEGQSVSAGAYANGLYYYGRELYQVQNWFRSINPLTLEEKNIGDHSTLPDYNYYFTDMTYDYVTQQMFVSLLKFPKDNEDLVAYVLATVDLETGELKEVGYLKDASGKGYKIMTIACNLAGEMYGTDNNKNPYFFKIDKSTAVITRISRGVQANFQINERTKQSMEFDHSTGTLYWTGVSRGMVGMFLTTIDPAKGMINSEVKEIPFQMAGLYIPFSNIASGAAQPIDKLFFLRGENGKLAVDLSWTNPNKTVGGDELKSISKIEIYRNDKLAHTLTDATPGSEQSWMDTSSELKNGFNHYKLIVFVGEDPSETAEFALYLGSDIPAQVNDLTFVQISNNSAKISWSAPTKGSNDAWLDESTLTYSIMRLPDSVMVAQDIRMTEFTDDKIENIEGYSYLVTASSLVGAGKSSVTDIISMGTPLQVPPYPGVYEYSMATPREYAKWTTINVNNDSYKWVYGDPVYISTSYGVANDLLISPMVHLEKGKSYKFGFDAKSALETAESFEIVVGSGKEASLMNQVLKKSSVTLASYQTCFGIFNPLETGDYHFAVRATTEGGSALFVANFAIQINDKGSLEGVVSSAGEPVAGFAVTLKSIGETKITDESGRYFFDYAEAGQDYLVFEKHGYVLQEIPVKVSDYTITKTDVSVDRVPKASLSGKLIDENATPVSGAYLYLKGYDSYCVVSGLDGSFSFENVYQAKDYQLHMTRAFIKPTVKMVDIEQSNLSLEPIVLSTDARSPLNLQTEIKSKNILLNWDLPDPMTLYCYDSGLEGGSVGAQSAAMQMGRSFQVPAVYHKLSWKTTKGATPLETVDIHVYALDERGMPTTNLLASFPGVPNTCDAWSSFEFPTPVYAEHGICALLGSTSGQVVLTLMRSSEAYPFMAFQNWALTTTTGKWINGMNGVNFAVRAEGIPLLAQLVRARMTKMPNLKPIADLKYRVFRLKEEDIADPTLWSLLTSTPIEEKIYEDITFDQAVSGIYRYAVTAVYNGSIVSDVVMSDPIEKDMRTVVSAMVITNNPKVTAEGAKVTLSIGDDVKYSGYVNAEAKVVLEDVLKGHYTMSITKDGFSELVSDLNLTSDNEYILSSQTLLEKLISPYNLEINIPEDGEGHIFQWNINYGFLEDFESHIPFAINSAGDLGWQYHSVNQVEKAVYSGMSFENNGGVYSAIVFNPSEVSPSMENNIPIKSGKNALAFSRASEETNDDYLISPELNFPRPFKLKFSAFNPTYNYGEEKFRVGYSRTDTDPLKFIWVTGLKNILLDYNGPSWTEYSFTIPANAKYIAINYMSSERFMLLIDDIYVGIEGQPVSVGKPEVDLATQYEIYLDGVLVGTSQTTSYRFPSLTEGEHQIGVKSIYESGATELTSMNYTVVQSGLNPTESAGLCLYPNPVSDELFVSEHYQKVEIFDMTGTLVKVFHAEQRLLVNDLLAGMYMVRIERDGAVFNHRIIIE